ncbi:MAG: type IV secretion system protein [Pseudomonadota bacterium]
MESSDFQHSFEDEVLFTLQQQRNNWARVAVGSMLMAILSLVALIVILPLNETKPFVVLVDKTTGEAEKIVQVRPASLQQQEAVLQAELVSYITDRETFDPADNNPRITDVMTRSEEQAADSLAAIWNSSSEQYPPHVYGQDVRVSVVVKSIALTPSETQSGYDLARVRITKHREEDGESVVERTFVVTVGYKFEPDQEASLQTVWKNPLGFRVLAYRIDAELAG